MRRPSVSPFAFLLFLAGACGGTRTTTMVCEPACPPNQTCTEAGCVLKAGEANDMAVESTGDLANDDCSPPCAAPTPFCNAERRCAPCLADGHCPTGQVCRVVGLTTACVPGCSDDTRCGAAGRCCAGHCTDVASDARNCGACGQSCGAQHSTPSCEGGRCAPGPCHRGYGDCNGDPADGCETRLDQDPDHCNGCGKKCSIAHAVVGCAGVTDQHPNGCYMRGCEFGFGDCNGEPNDGCEASVTADVRNCGACGFICPSVPNSKVGCLTGLCAVTGCNAGYSDCDRNPKNGCEVDSARDRNNCGACGAACGQGQVCVNGACTCQQCNIANAKTKCVNNMCVFDACVQGFADCDVNINNGCEVNIAGDPANCGACGAACDVGLRCVNGACAMAVGCNAQGMARGCASVGDACWCKTGGQWATGFAVCDYQKGYAGTYYSINGRDSQNPKAPMDGNKAREILTALKELPSPNHCSAIGKPGSCSQNCACDCATNILAGDNGASWGTDLSCWDDQQRWERGTNIVRCVNYEQ